MGFQPIGPRKMRQAREHTGLDILRLLRHTNYHWLAVIRHEHGHRHVSIDPQTWEWEWDIGCFTTCSEGKWGPYIDVPDFVPPGYKQYASVYR